MPVRRSSNRIPSSPAAEVEAPIKQGIGTILGADRGGSIRRTLSADMSSKKWLQQNGFFSPMKKIDYSQEMAMAMAAAHHSSGSSSSSSDGEEEIEENQDQDEVWRSIQLEKESEKADQSGVWGSILTQKSENSLVLPPTPPYVFAPVERSASSMNEKSLEICTESLGSETGSDCFSCLGEAEGLKDGDEEREEKQRSEDPSVDLHVVKYRYSPVRPFPPPLPSLAGGDGASLRMRSHRQDGRLILEAVSVASRNCFHAQRNDGRLVLTLMHGGAEEEKFETADRGGDNVYKVEEGEGGDKQENLSLPSGMLSVHKSGLVMKKLMGVKNINPKWSNKLNEEEELPIPHSLPPRPPVTRPIGSPPAASSFNVYEYFWRSKPSIIYTKNNINQDLVQSKTEHLLPCMKRRCKEARRSLIWEPYCIATS